MGEADGKIEDHIVCVVKAGKEGEVCDMRKEGKRAEARPEDVPPRVGHGHGGRGKAMSVSWVEVEETDGSVVEAVKNCEGSGEIVKLLGDRKICIPEKKSVFSMRGLEVKKERTSSVEDRRPDPCVHTGKGKAKIVLLHRVRIRDAYLDLTHTAVVGDEVEYGEEHGRGLLHTREPPERPLAVVLLNGGIVLDGDVGDHVHAFVFAVIQTCPPCEPQRHSERRRRRDAT